MSAKYGGALSSSLGEAKKEKNTHGEIKRERERKRTDSSYIELRVIPRNAVKFR